jgi:DNA ligase-1
MKFALLVEYFGRIEETTKRLEMFDILSELFKEARAEEIDRIVYLSQGQLMPPFHGIEIGMSEKLLIRALSEAANAPTKEVEELYREMGDLGLAAERLAKGKGGLSVENVYEELYSVASTSGKGSVDAKINLLSSLLRAASPKEAKYIARFVIGRLRLGIGDPTVLEALALIRVNELYDMPFERIEKSRVLLKKLKDEGLMHKELTMENPEALGQIESLNRNEVFNKVFEDLGRRKNKSLKNLLDTYEKEIKKLIQSRRSPLERAYNLCSDLGLVARTVKAEGMDGIRKFRIRVGYPVRVALCERLPSSEDIINKIGRAAIEAKYDGFRCQVHKKGENIEIFSRNLERMTHMFPEITESARALSAKETIIEGEALAHNESTGELLPFQVTIQRKRKHGIEAAAKEFPLKFFAFELLYLNGEDYTERPYMQRRERLVQLLKGVKGVIEPARMFLTDDPKEIRLHFEEFVDTGLEGVVAKRLDSPYTAGSRNFNWIKLKRSYRGELADTVDVCVIGYFLGRGARAKFGIGALLAAVYDPDADAFKSVTKIGTGFTEEQFAELKEMLDKVALKKKHPRVDSDMAPDVWVEPRYVVTVTADEITRSPSHTAGRDDEGVGYALRFPRAVGFLRDDKNPEDANTVKEVIDMAGHQKKVKTK